MSTPLTAADYCDWCKYAGLYLDNISHADRYRTFARKISRAGLAVKIVHDLLEGNPGGLDLQAYVARQLGPHDVDPLEHRGSSPVEARRRSEDDVDVRHSGHRRTADRGRLG